ncbi:hypothetical protein [Streptomyces sp. NPDC003023]|uniref:hypothetical protein n=1 Tax=Streptomyces sp. NPDC003023 TaxID=3364675 RepID=UPI0036A9F44D
MFRYAFLAARSAVADAPKAAVLPTPDAAATAVTALAVAAAAVGAAAARTAADAVTTAVAAPLGGARS